MDGNTFGRISQSVCVSVCPVRAPTFEILDLETSFLVWRYIFRISKPSSYVIKITGGKMEFTRITKPMHSRVVRLRLEGKVVLGQGLTKKP